MVNPKEAGDAAEVEALGEAVTKKANVKDEESGHSSEGEGEGEPAGAPTGEATAGAKAKKKKSKKSKVKKALGLGGGGGDPGGSNPASKLTPGMVEQLLEMNPSLKGEVAGMNKEKAAEVLKKLEVGDLLTGMSVSGKNQKDMASYKFWQTQPVPRFDETRKDEEGPIKAVDPSLVPKEPRPLYEGFEWVTMDLTDATQLQEVYELLSGHYVEDENALFRLTYSASFLNWALMSPGWLKEWHVGVRATRSKKLVAFISGVPIALRVRAVVIEKSTEINFLCIHKKLRSKRLAPVLIEEVTRRCNLLGVYQAIYTGGIVLPKPVSSCRYFHRPLDWMKLYEAGFSGLPHKSTPARQVAKHNLPNATSLPGLRPMQKQDAAAVQDLLSRYLKLFDMAPEYSVEEIEHWLVHDEEKYAEQVVWAYVVEDPTTQKITDFFSYYCLESVVIGSSKHKRVRAAYCFYYGTETAFEKNEKGLKERLNALMADCLITAKKYKFDVFNALTLLDNPLFLESQKFGEGDGQLHFYLYNYRTKPIPGGVDARNKVDDKQRGGVGVVML